MNGERLIKVNDVELCMDSAGDPADPAILLIGGAAASMDWWEDEFCQRLAGPDRYVIRYDNRDTGRSTSYPPGKPGYTGDDLTSDAVGLLAALDISGAHMVGISMGAGIALELALDHPKLVATLTTMSASPLGDDLPPPAERVSAMFASKAPGPDWTDRDAAISAMVEPERIFAGSLPFDDQHVRALAERAYERTNDMAAMQTNHWILEGNGEPIRPRLRRITAPTLVIHGTEDPLFPFPHAEALAREIPGAHLVPVEGMGHQYPPPEAWDLVIPAIREHTMSARS